MGSLSVLTGDTSPRRFVNYQLLMVDVPYCNIINW